MTERLEPIGRVASRLGLSTRTLRYYEEVGLLAPTGRSAGGARRYTEGDVQRVEHIRKLQALVGLDLDRIRTFVTAEDRLHALRMEYRAGADPARLVEIATEGEALYQQMADQVRDRMVALQGLMSELEAGIERTRQARLEHGAVATAAQR